MDEVSGWRWRPTARWPRPRDWTGSASARKRGRRSFSDQETSSSWCGRRTGIDPAVLEGWAFDHFLVQPMDCEAREEAIEAAVRLAMERPKWRLSLQAHKVVGLP